MAKIDFTEIKREYLTTGKSLRDLASKYGVSFSYLSEVSAREGWVGQKEIARTKAGQMLVEKTAESLSEINLRHTNIWKVLQGESMRKIQAFREDGELIPDDTLKSLAQVLRVAIEGERVAVGLPTQITKAQQTQSVTDEYDERIKKMDKIELIREVEKTLEQVLMEAN